MNLPNRLTLARIALIPVFVFFAEQSPYWAQLVAAAVFALASFTDYLDGHIARRDNLVTNFGKFVDPIADKLLVMSAFVVFVGQNRVPAWLCILLLAREFAISGFRAVAAGGGKVIAAAMLGKIKTVTQMATILMMLVLAPLGSFWRALTYIVLYISLIFSIWSCVDYIWKSREFIQER